MKLLKLIQAYRERKRRDQEAAADEAYRRELISRLLNK